jgi:hypothetical protein
MSVIVFELRAVAFVGAIVVALMVVEQQIHPTPMSGFVALVGFVFGLPLCVALLDRAGELQEKTDKRD